MRCFNTHLFVLAEPVDMEHLREFTARCVCHAEPVFEVVAKVVSKEWPHCKWIVHYNLTLRHRNS